MKKYQLFPLILYLKSNYLAVWVQKPDASNIFFFPPMENNIAERPVGGEILEAWT